MKPTDLIGTHWRQEAEETPYRAQNTRMNVQTQVHEVGLKRIDTGDTPGVGYIWIDPETLIKGEEGWVAADEPAREAITNFGPVTPKNVMLEAAVEAVKQASLTCERDPRLASLSLGELVNRGAAYVLEIEAHFTGNVGTPEPAPATESPAPVESPPAVESSPAVEVSQPVEPAVPVPGPTAPPEAPAEWEDPGKTIDERVTGPDAPPPGP